MFKKTHFVFREFIRFFKKNFKLNLHNIYISFFYLLAITFNITILFNIKFLGETDAFQLEGNIRKSFFSKIHFLEKFNFFFYISLVMLIFFYIYFQKKRIKYFIEKFNEELSLIRKIKGDDSEGRLVLYYLIMFNSFFVVFLSWLTGYFIYRIFSKFKIFSLLDFSNFKITLFIFVLIIAESSGLFSLYYLFWKREKH